jgi:ATP-binding cassette subfamily B protein/subfamily B ATP-binding cassette protein MsbA
VNSFAGLVPHGTESTARWVFSLMRRYRGRAAALAGLSIAEIALRALLPWPIKAVVDRLTIARPSRDAGTAIVAIAAAGCALQLAHQLVLMAHTRSQARLAQRMVFDVRAALFTHLQRVSLADHHRASAADAVQRLDADAGCLEALVLRGVFPMVFSALTLVAMFAVLFRLDAGLALLALAVVPLLYAAFRFFMPRLRPRAERARASEATLVERLHESVASIHLVKSYAREEHEQDRFTGAAREAMRRRRDAIDTESWFSFSVGAVTVLGAAAVLAVGGLHVLAGRITAGTLLVVIAYLGFVYGPMSAIATTGGSLQHALVSLGRVREVLVLPAEEADAAAKIDPGRLAGHVVFDNVSFSYGPGRPALDRVSFSAAAGETVALVGRSGAGKTTVAALIARLHNPSAGRVVIDGIDARAIRLSALRQQVALVPQDATLLSGTIEDNIRYGRLDATDAEVWKAAQDANCEQFVADFPDGLQTAIGDTGRGLSGGQRQRVAIARAFLKDAPLLVLDEPTAALDTLSEHAILDALERLGRGRTLFVIAHRLTTVRRADRILVLDSGRLIAQGRHEELLHVCPLYHDLCSELDLDLPGARTA